MKKKLLIICGLLFILIIWWYYQFSVIHDNSFALVDVDYVGYDEFYAVDDDYNDIIVSSDDYDILSAILSGENKMTNEKEDLRLLATYTRAYLEHDTDNYLPVYDFYRLGDVIQADGAFAAICSGYAKFFALLAQVYGYESRVVWMFGHVANEVYLPSLQKWVYVDADKNVLLENKQGQLLNLGDILIKKEPFVIVPLTDHQSNDDDFSDDKSFYDFLLERKKILVLGGNDVFTYSFTMGKLWLIFWWIVWFDAPAKWKQLYFGEWKKIGNLDILSQLLRFIHVE